MAIIGIKEVLTIEKDNSAMVFDVQRYSLHDGPGIRTIIFLKGCPLRCLWCCNPESQETHVEVEFHKDSCRRCGRCAAVCEKHAMTTVDGIPKIDRVNCLSCGRCVKECPHGALRKVGQQMETREIMRQINADRAYFRRSGGGVTLSGGEPLMWIGFCEKLLRDCYDLNINTAVETTGCVPTEDLERVLNYVDVFLYDIKSIDDTLHRKLTGTSNGLILKNIKYLRERGKNVIMRIPLIPKHNFIRKELAEMLALADEIGIREINLMPYHNLGEEKYERLSREYSLKGLEALKFSDDMEAQIGQYNDIFEKYDDIHIAY